VIQMMLRRVFPQLIILAVLLTAGSQPATAGAGLWTSSGPEGGRVEGLVASPFNPDEFYALANGSVFKSINGGVTWIERSAGINRAVFRIAHSGTAAGRLLVSSVNKVFFSNDGAVTWSDRTPPAATLAGATMGALASSPSQPGTYYLALSDGRILITEDSGATWRASAPIVQPDDFFITAIAADPAVPYRLLVATDTGFSVSDHRLWVGDLSDPPPATVWTQVACPAGCPWELAPLLDLDFGSAGRVWAISNAGAARSDDAGVTWTIPGGLNNVYGSALDIHPADNTRIYVAGRQGLAYTTDDGATWTPVLAGFAGNNLLQPAFSTVVAYNPFNPALQLAGSNDNGVYRRNSTVLDTFVPETAGFTAQQIRAVASNTLNRVHAAVSDSFGATYVSFISSNNGLTWSSANGGLEADQFRALVVDPNDPDIVYAGGRFDPKEDDTGTLVPANGGLYKSTNGGLNWTTIDNGIPSPPPGGFSPFGTVRDLAIDATSADPVTGESQVLYATGTGRFQSDGAGGFTPVAARVYKSIDAGANWSASDAGIGGIETMPSGRTVYASGVQILVDPTDATGQTLWLATFIGRSPTDVPTTLDNGVFRSTDGGATWTHRSAGLPLIGGAAGASTADVLSLALDPTDPTGATLYASVNDLGNSALGTIYKTTDAGSTWSFSGTGLVDRDVRDIAVDPATGNVYAAIVDPLGNGDGGVFVSDDGGASWASISTGFPATAVALKLELDNSGPNLLIHAGTSRGLQSFEVLPDGDTDGATDATEDAAPAGARGLQGDGNGDGTPDRLQQEVASPQVLTATRGTPVTITASVTPISGTCDRLENSFGLPLLTGVPDEDTYEAPYSGLHLRIPDCERAEVEMVYHGRAFGDDPTWRMRGYGLAFPDEDSAEWTDSPGAGRSGNIWTFRVGDGEGGDATPDDGVIVFQGAAKRLRERFFAGGFEAE
jgi:photosystem II stability/assembly factor-like uncharacterized protein